MSLFAYSLTDLWSRVDKQGYVCGSKNLIESMEKDHSTPFLCKLSGMFIRQRWHV